MKLRIKFKKYGPVRFVGHLDVMRFFQKALRRAGIDVTYTTGFSPHQVMSFAAPLGVGLTSNGEYMDIQVNSLPEPDPARRHDTMSAQMGTSARPDISETGEHQYNMTEQGKEYSERLNPCRFLVDRLNAVSVQGLDVISARILPEDAGNAMASVAAASYTVRFREGREPDSISGQSEDSGDTQPLQNALAEFLSKDEIIITKETKKGTREVNLRQGIYELTWQDDFFFMLLDASSAGNIKPSQVISAFLEDCGEKLKENALLITREDVFTNLGEGENHKFVSLGEIGSEELFDLHEKSLNQHTPYIDPAYDLNDNHALDAQGVFGDSDETGKASMKGGAS